MTSHKDWAKEKGVGLEYGIIIKDVKKDITNEELKDELKAIGAGQVIDRRDVEEGEETTHEVLYMFKGKVGTLLLGGTINVTGGTKWAVLRLKDPDDSADPFAAELQKFLAAHKKTLEDLAIQEAVHKHVHVIKEDLGLHLTRPQYRRLKNFSGKVPVPNGESAFDMWVEHADQVAQDTNLSEEDRKSRLVDVLAPPALTIYRKTVQASGPSVTAAEILVQLRRAFGIACESGDLYLVFRETYQTADEAPAAYLTRLEEALDRAIAFGEVSPSEADSLRLTPYIRGCVYSAGLVGALQLRQRRETPPTFVDLLQEVRVEEAAEVARVRRRELDIKPSKKAQANSVAASDSSKGLTKEVGKLKAQLAALQAPVPPAVANVSQSPLPSQGGSPDLMAEVMKLKKALEDLQQGNLGRQPRPRASTFCYRCGLQGHISKGCNAAPNAELVQQKLLERSQTSGNGRGRLQEGQQVPKQH
jgi:hypothetical protein